MSQARHESSDCGLKQILAEIIPEKQKQVKEFRASKGSFVVGEVNVDMVSVCVLCVCVCVCVVCVCACCVCVCACVHVVCVRVVCVLYV